jgi:hypothetical protein
MIASPFMAVALAVAAASAAAPAPEAVDLTGHQAEAGKVFPYIEHFLKMPAAEHTDYTVAYYFRRDGKPAGDAGAVLTDGATRIPLPVNADGRFLTLPTLAEVQNHDMVSFNNPGGAKMKVRIGLAPIAAPALNMDAGAMARAIWQANTAIHHLVGPLSLAVPRLKSVLFDSAEGGAAVMADGTTVPLPLKKDGPYFDPSKIRNAVNLTFTKAAVHIDIQP